MFKDVANDVASLSPGQRMSQLIRGYRISQLVCIAAKLRIPDQLGERPRNAEELAESTGISLHVLLRLLRGFTMCGLIYQREDRYFELTTLGECLKSGVPGSLYTFAVRTHDMYYPAWGAFLRAIQAGKTAFEQVFGDSYFEYLSHNPQHACTFNALMSENCKDGVEAIVSAYEFVGVRHVVDVGGGEGVLLTAILKNNLLIQGTLFDTNSALEHAQELLSDAGVADRCSVVPGDFFVALPAGGDVYILRHILHDWNDECCLRILRKCFRAVGKSARLITIERVVPEEETWSPVAIGSDLHMLVLMGGVERTQAEFQALMAAAGFRLSRAVPTGSSETILEWIPLK